MLFMLIHFQKIYRKILILLLIGKTVFIYLTVIYIIENINISTILILHKFKFSLF